MKLLRVIDEIGNKTDYETEFVPRTGERISLTYGRGGNPITEHFFRVKDVMYRLDQAGDTQASILIEEEAGAESWPS